LGISVRGRTSIFRPGLRSRRWPSPAPWWNHIGDNRGTDSRRGNRRSALNWMRHLSEPWLYMIPTIPRVCLCNSAHSCTAIRIKFQTAPLPRGLPGFSKEWLAKNLDCTHIPAARSIRAIARFRQASRLSIRRAFLTSSRSRRTRQISAHSSSLLSGSVSFITFSTSRSSRAVVSASGSKMRPPIS